MQIIDGAKLVEKLRLIATCWSISPFVSKEKHNGAVDMLREVEKEIADNLECREVCERQGDAGCKTCPIAKALDRLAAYEDTGLEPEEITELKSRMEGLEK